MLGLRYQLRRERNIHTFFRNRLFYGWVIIAAGLLIGVTGIGGRFAFGVFLRSIEAEFGMTRTASSGIFSVYMLLCVFIATLGGWAMDRYGPRKVGLVTGSFMGLSFLMTSQINASWQFYISYSLLLSLGTGSIYTLVNSTASRWFVRKRGFVVGITSSGGGTGIIVIAPFAAYLISIYDWRRAFIVLGLIGWAFISVSSLFLKKDPREMGLFPDGDKSNGFPTGTGKAESGPRSHDFLLGEASRTWNFWLMVFTWVFLSLSLHMVIVHVVPYAIERDLSPMKAAFILSLMGFANIPGRLMVGKLSDTLGRKALGVLCAFIQFLTLLLLIWARELWTFYAFAVLFGFLWGGSGTVTTALIGDIFGTRSLGSIMGIMSSGFALGAALGPALGGVIFDMTGHYFPAFATGAATLLVAAMFMAIMRLPPSSVDKRAHS